jgi:hypothetical protein
MATNVMKNIIVAKIFQRVLAVAMKNIVRERKHLEKNIQ